MKRLLPLFLVVLGGVVLVGCGGDEKPVAEDMTAKIKALPAEERFRMIRDEKTLSIPQKLVSIDQLPVDDGQKAKWKAEIQGSGGSGPGNASAGQTR